MPRYYCDYCDTYLTHDSPAVRKQHNAGYKHKANVRNYYMQFEESQTPSSMDARVKEFDARSREAFQAAVAANFMSEFGGPRPVGPPPVRPGAPAPRGQMRAPPMPGRPPFQFRAAPPGSNTPSMPFPGAPRPMIPGIGAGNPPPRGDISHMRGVGPPVGMPPHGHMAAPLAPPPQGHPGMQPPPHGHPGMLPMAKPMG